MHNHSCTRRRTTHITAAVRVTPARPAATLPNHRRRRVNEWLCEFVHTYSRITIIDVNLALSPSRLHHRTAASQQILYNSAVLAVFVCPSVCSSVCLTVRHTPVLYQNG